METKYKAGDIVRIKSKEWYDKTRINSVKYGPHLTLGNT